MKRVLFKSLPPVLAPLIGLGYRLFLATCRITEVGREYRERAREEGLPRIFAVWHANILLAPPLAGDVGPDGAALVSARGWGELFARIIQKLGHRTIRGSSTRRGAPALRELVKHLRGGGFAALVPDGPRGPAFRVKPGMVLAASLSGAVIIPVCFEASPQRVARGWDRQRFPWPFAHIHILYGEPMVVAPDLDERGLEDARLRVEQAMNENMERCGEAVRDSRRS